jgi:hypothetical protein
MAELSKTARASQIRETPKEVRVETTEEAIRQIRIDREAKLFVTRMDRIDKLLGAFEEADLERIDVSSTLAEINNVLELRDGESAVARIKALLNAEAREELRKSLPILKEAMENSEFLVMAEISAQEHDEHHLVDFGHSTVHDHHEGA